jgi:hypothetical protein
MTTSVNTRAAAIRTSPQRTAGLTLVPVDRLADLRSRFPQNWAILHRLSKQRLCEDRCRHAGT